MDVKTSCQILLGVLLASVGIAILGLTADNVAHVNNHTHPSPMGIHYIRWNETAQGQYSYWVTIDYLPSRFSMSTTNGVLAASVVCTIVGAGVAVSSFMMRGKKTLETSFAPKKMLNAFLPLTMIFTTIAFIMTLALAIYAWQPTMNWPTNFTKYFPAPKNHFLMSRDKPMVYQSPLDFTPEVWNCLVYPYVVDPKQGQRLQSLCREAGIAKDLMIPMLILSAALLSCLGWSWRSARVAAASSTETNAGKDVEELSVQSKE